MDFNSNTSVINILENEYIKKDCHKYVLGIIHILITKMKNRPSNKRHNYLINTLTFVIENWIDDLKTKNLLINKLFILKEQNCMKITLLKTIFKSLTFSLNYSKEYILKNNNELYANTNNELFKKFIFENDTNQFNYKTMNFIKKLKSYILKHKNNNTLDNYIKNNIINYITDNVKNIYFANTLITLLKYSYCGCSIKFVIYFIFTEIDSEI
jgi:hypothetical protein